MSRNRSDILEGNIGKAMLAFAIPIALSSLLQQLFTATDQAVVGQFAGSSALAAVGANSSLVGLLINVFGSIAVGTNAQIALAIGAGKRDRITQIVHTSIAFAAMSGIFMLILTQFIAYQVHVLIGTPKDVIDQAVSYLKIFAFGFPFTLLYNFGSAILRSKGDTKRPMAALITAGVVNVILNLVFVIGLKMGVKGVALATAISNVLSSSLVMMFLCRETDEMRLIPRQIRIHLSSLLSIVRIGGPAAIQSAVFSVANVSIQSGINSLGRDAMAGSAAAQNFEFISYFFTNAFSQALTTFCGQNYGAKNYQRCKKIIRIAFLENLIVVMTFDVLVNVFRYPLSMIFTTDPAVMQFMYYRLMIVVGLHFMITSYELLASAMRSMGYALMPALLTIIGSVGFRITWLFTVFRIWPNFCALMGVYPASWVVTGTLVFTYYLSKKKKMGLA